MAETTRKTQARADAGPARTDGWQNFLTGLGTQRDKRTHTHFGGAMVFPNGQLLDELYAGDDMIARIVDLPAREMTREWIDMRVGEDPEAAAALLQRLDDLDIQSKTEEALAWARLHGGALMILGLDDGQAPELPLREEKIRSFRWVTVLDRWEVQVAKRYGDPLDPRYGKPEVYRIQPQSEGGGVSREALVHASRTIRFDGVRTPKRRMALLEGWCDGIVPRVYETVRDFAQSYAGAASALADFSQATVKIKDLAQLLAADQEDLALKRIQMMDMARSIARMIPLDAEKEAFEIVTRTLTGMPETLDRLAQRLSAATEIPVTLLMGQSPAGLNATGASDIRLFYDRIRSQQENDLRPRLGRLIELLWRAKDGPTSGQEPEDWSLEFRPLWQPTAKESAEERFITAQTDKIYLDAGVVRPAEIAVSRWGGDRWSPETAIDIEDLEGDRERDLPPGEPSSDPDPTPQSAAPEAPDIPAGAEAAE